MGNQITQIPCLVETVTVYTLTLNSLQQQSSPGRQGLARVAAALPTRSSSLGLWQAAISESPWWDGSSSVLKAPDGPGLGSADPRTSSTWLLTSAILLRTSAIWALRRMRTPESGADRRTTCGRRSRSFLEWGWAEDTRNKLEKQIRWSSKYTA